MLTALDEHKFELERREPLLTFGQYLSNFTDCADGIDTVTESLVSPHPNATPFQFVEATMERAWCASMHLTNCYSGGHSIADLRSFFTPVLEFWEEFAYYQRVFHAVDRNKGWDVANIPLLGANFHRASELLCFAVLLGLRQYVPRIVSIIDYNNPTKDAMLERMISILMPGARQQPPDKCTRHLPYSKTLKIFGASPTERPGMIAAYLADWYHASRREPYYDSANHPTFTGFWSYEAAAITLLLEIDDSKYAAASFYPADLVKFGRGTRTYYETPDTGPSKNDEVRARSGDLCPKAGIWSSLGAKVENREYGLGERLIDLGSAYGFTVWRYLSPLQIQK